MKQDHSALVKSNYDNLPREAKKTADSKFDRIWKYYHNNKTRVELTDEEQRIRERWEKAWMLLCRNRTQKDAADLIMRLFNVSRSVAFDDVNNAMMLFSNPNADLKEGKRAIAENALMRGADKAWKEGNMDMYLKFYSKYIEINGLTVQEDDKMKDILKHLKPTTLVFVTSPEQLKAQADELIKDIPAVDTNFEEVPDET